MEKGAEDLRNYMKRRAKELGLKDIRVNGAGCLDRCEEGPVVVIYPEGVWYSPKNEADCDEIVTKHLQQGSVVERFSPPTASGIRRSARICEITDGNGTKVRWDSPAATMVVDTAMP